jgi:uncharacterized protein YecT (DUF1311 family)
MLILALLGLAVAEPGCKREGTQTELNFCARDDYRAADMAMNAQLRRTLTVVELQQKYFISTFGVKTASYSDRLMASQRAWIAYRDAECSLRTWASQFGSMEPMISYKCLAQMTLKRTADLAQLVEKD